MSTSAKSSGLLTASGVVATGRNRIDSIVVLTDGTNAATVTVFDNASAGSGLVLSKHSIPGASLSTTFTPAYPIFCENGLYVTITGTGANAIVHFGG